MINGSRGGHRGIETRWRGRPVLAALLQGALVVAPVVAATAVVRATTPVTGGLPTIARLVLGVTAAIAVAVLAERWLRRFLPLAALLRMTMLFPDRAPSRLAVAKRIGHPSRLAAAAAARSDETLAEAAERILVLISTLGAHDRRTRGHSERVRVFTDLVSGQLGLDDDARDRLRWAALLHDLGKIDVPAAVLNKPASLDESEWELIRRHPERGVERAGPLTTWLGPWAAAIGEHHERFDGTGYPRGLSGQDIALAGRVVAVADTFEVMTAARSYKRPMSVRAARAELARVAGTQLDPMCVRALLSASLPRLLWTIGPLSMLVNLPFLRSLGDVGQALGGTATGFGGQAAATGAAAAITGLAVVAAPSAAASPPPRPVTISAATAHPSSTPVPESTRPSASSVASPSATQPAPHSTGPRQQAAPSPTPSPPSATIPTATTSPPRTGVATTSPSPLPSGPGPTSSAGSPSPTQSNPGATNPDRTPPTVTITAAPVLQLLTSKASLSFTSDDPGATYTCRLDGNPWQSCTSPVTYTGLKLGGHRIEVRATDAAGNVSDPVRADFTVISLGVLGL